LAPSRRYSHARESGKFRRLARHVPAAGAFGEVALVFWRVLSCKTKCSHPDLPGCLLGHHLEQSNQPLGRGLRSRHHPRDDRPNRPSGRQLPPQSATSAPRHPPTRTIANQKGIRLQPAMIFVAPDSTAHAGTSRRSSWFNCSGGMPRKPALPIPSRRRSANSIKTAMPHCQPAAGFGLPRVACSVPRGKFLAITTAQPVTSGQVTPSRNGPS
jgi:hypothetical protein